MITRAEPDAARVCDELRLAGIDARAIPCIERVPRDVPSWRPSGHRVVLFTSVATVEVVGPRLWVVAPHEVAALAPATATALGAMGCRVTIESTAGVGELVTRIEEQLHRRAIVDPAFWYPTSDAGLETDEQRAAVERLSRLGPVTRTVVYETRAPSALAQHLAQLSGPFGVVFASPSSVENFVAASAPAPARVVCWGHSTLTAARRFFSTAVEHDRSRPLAVTLSTEPSHA